MAIEADFLGQQLSRMVVNWRLNLAGEDRKRLKEEFRPLLTKWGDVRFRVCVDRAIREHATGFFPSVAEFIAFDCGSIGPQNLQTCAMCRNSEGWVFGDYEHDGKLIRNAARRCQHPGAA